MAKKKIAVLGGGVGAMVAAYELANSPNADEYEITLYQQGWRLGGKGASGRNRDHCQRIEEHGGHLWFGFYENGFSAMGRAYADLTAQGKRSNSAPLGDLWKAFKGHKEFTLEENLPGKGWKDWTISMPVLGGLPGDGRQGLHHRHLILGLFDRFEEHYRTTLNRHSATDWAQGLYASTATHADTSHLRRASYLMRTLEEDQTDHDDEHRGTLLGHLHAFRDALRPHLVPYFEKPDEPVDSDEPADSDVPRIGLGDVARRLWIIMDLGLTALIGLAEDRVLLSGLNSLDDQDFHAWLIKHGLSPAAQWSAPIRFVYDVIFAFPGGIPDRDHASLAAGTAVRGCLRMIFGYKGHFWYAMQAGMGDTVFTPFYQALEHKVDFRFFHRVDQLVPGPEGMIDEIHITRQVQLAQDRYDPLVEVKGLPCWPSAPFYDQIEDGEWLERLEVNLERRSDRGFKEWAEWSAMNGKSNVTPLVLRRGTDFDEVVLGIAIGELVVICPDLADPAKAGKAAERWRNMLGITTVNVQAFQMWLYPDIKALGWTGNKARDADEPPVVGCYEEPFSTWADFSHLIDKEDWPEDDLPKNCGYFFGVMPDAEGGPNALDTVRNTAWDFVENHIGYLWPRTDVQDMFQLDKLTTCGGGHGKQRFEQQFFRSNDEGSERYVLSAAGQTRLRLKADESGFSNLFLAGDWTETGFDVGCVEAATMSGMQASRAICGFPEKIHGENDFPGLGRWLLSHVWQYVKRLWARFCYWWLHRRHSGRNP